MGARGPTLGDMEAVTDEVIAKVKAANPGVELHHATHPNLPDEIILRPANVSEYRIFQNMQADATQRTDANRMLVDTCVLWPEKAELQKSLAAHPALVDVWSGEIAEATGFTRAARRKKL